MDNEIRGEGSAGRKSAAKHEAAAMTMMAMGWSVEEYLSDLVISSDEEDPGDASMGINSRESNAED